MQRLFFHKMRRFKIFRNSAIPSSIYWSHPVNWRYRISQLARFTNLAGLLSIILWFKQFPESFHEVQITPNGIFQRGKVLIKITRSWWEWELRIFWDVYRLFWGHSKNRKSYIFRSTGNNLLIKTVKCSPFKQTFFLWVFTPIKMFQQGNNVFQMTRHPKMIIRGLSFSAVFCSVKA